MKEPPDIFEADRSWRETSEGTKHVTVASTSKFLRFLFTGGIAAFANITIRYLFTPILGFEISVLGAYLIGMVIAYVLFRSYVFGRSGRSVTSESYRFVAVNIIALGLVWGVSVGLARVLFPAIGWTWHAEDLAHLIGVGVPVISSYVGHSKYTFGRTTQ